MSNRLNIENVVVERIAHGQKYHAIWIWDDDEDSLWLDPTDEDRPMDLPEVISRMEDAGQAIEDLLWGHLEAGCEGLYFDGSWYTKEEIDKMERPT